MFLFRGGRGGFWEGRRCLNRGFILGRRVDSGSVAYIYGLCLGGVIFWDGRVDLGSENTSHKHEKGRGGFNYDTQFDLDEIVDLYPKLHTCRLELDSLL